MGCHLTAYRARELHTAAEVFSNRKEVRARLAALHRPEPPPPVVVEPPPPLAPEPEPQLETQAPETKPWKPTGRKISDVVAFHYGLTRAEIRGGSRRKIYVNPRHVAMFICVKFAGLSFMHTARVFNRDHTSVLHGVKRIERMCVKDSAVWADVDAIINEIGEAT